MHKASVVLCPGEHIGEFMITIPPLRERTEDILFFAEKFIFEFSTELNKLVRGITVDAAELLTAHPGRVTSRS